MKLRGGRGPNPSSPPFPPSLSIVKLHHRIWLGTLMEYTLSIIFFYLQDLNNTLVKKAKTSFTRTNHNVGSIVWLWPHIRKKMVST